MSSWSLPIAPLPLLLSTPIMRNGIFLTRISLPTGSSSPNRFLTTVLPTTATRSRFCTFFSDKNRPDFMVQLLTSK